MEKHGHQTDDFGGFLPISPPGILRPRFYAHIKQHSSVSKVIRKLEDSCENMFSFSHNYTCFLEHKNKILTVAL